MIKVFSHKSEAALVAAIAALSFGSAQAAGTTTALAVNVTANVLSTCQATATKADVAFGPIAAFLAGSQASLGGSVTFTCNKGATVGVTVSNGANFGAGQSLTLRAMKSGTADYISYHIYQPTGPTFAACGGTTEWTASFNISSLWASNGGPNTINLCGSVDAAPVTGYATGTTYVDIVSVQATF